MNATDCTVREACLAGMLEGTPPEFDGLQMCKQVPYTFFGREVRKPDWCERDGWGRVRGIWEIDFNVPECHPILKDYRDKVCFTLNSLAGLLT